MCRIKLVLSYLNDTVKRNWFVFLYNTVQWPHQSSVFLFCFLLFLRTLTTFVVVVINSIINFVVLHNKKTQPHGVTEV